MTVIYLLITAIKKDNKIAQNILKFKHNRFLFEVILAVKKIHLGDIFSWVTSRVWISAIFILLLNNSIRWEYNIPKCSLFSGSNSTVNSTASTPSSVPASTVPRLNNVKDLVNNKEVNNGTGNGNGSNVSSTPASRSNSEDMGSARKFSAGENRSV